MPLISETATIIIFKNVKLLHYNISRGPGVQSCVTRRRDDYQGVHWTIHSFSPNLERLVLGCIDAKFCKLIFVGKLLTRSTRCTYFCTAQISKSEICVSQTSVRCRRIEKIISRDMTSGSSPVCSYSSVRSSMASASTSIFQWRKYMLWIAKLFYATVKIFKSITALLSKNPFLRQNWTCVSSSAGQISETQPYVWTLDSSDYYGAPVSAANCSAVALHRRESSAKIKWPRAD